MVCGHGQWRRVHSPAWSIELLRGEVPFLRTVRLIMFWTIRRLGRSLSGLIALYE